MSTAIQIHDAPPAAVAAPPRSLVGLLTPIAAPQVVMQAQEAVRLYIKQTLTEGRDYGTIPGVDKPSMLKPGAERVCGGFGVTMQFEIVDTEIDHTGEYPWIKRKKKWNNKFKGDKSYTWEDERGVAYGLYRYVVRCTLVHRETGVVVGSCTGVCSTMESKYCDRPRDAENTALKMAQKRAMVGAVLTTFGLSDIFTQDVEDFPRDEVGHTLAAMERPQGNGGRAGDSRTPSRAATGSSPSTTDAPAQASDAEMTLAEAQATTLRGKAERWGGNGGKPLADVPTSVLEAALTFFSDKARAEPGDARLGAQIEALALVLDARAKDQTRLELEDAGPAAAASSDERPPAVVSTEGLVTRLPPPAPPGAGDSTTPH